MTNTVDWRAVFQAYKSRMDELEARYKAEADDLRAGMRLAQRMLAEPAEVPQIGPQQQVVGPYADKTVLDGSIEVIKAQGRPMTHGEIAKALQAGGKAASAESVHTLLIRASRDDRGIVITPDKRFDAVSRVMASWPTAQQQPA